MEKDECYNCKLILCESKFKRCDMCDFFSFCIECVPDTINFKVVELYVVINISAIWITEILMTTLT